LNPVLKCHSIPKVSIKVIELGRYSSGQKILILSNGVRLKKKMREKNPGPEGNKTPQESYNVTGLFTDAPV
jgi:hypothetical protein